MLESCVLKVPRPVHISGLGVCADFQEKSKLQRGSDLVMPAWHYSHRETTFRD